jgi:DNA-binding transcriptional LysR family regulator
VLLFDRSAKTPVPTDAGRVLTERARCVLRQADIFESTASAITSGLEPELTLAVDSFLPTQPLVESLRALKNTFPDLQVTLFTEGMGAAERRLRDDSATLAFCVLSPTSAQDLQAHPLMKVALVPVVAASRSLASATQPITRDLLQDEVQLVLTDPTNPRRPIL